jgi:N-acetylglucosaminyl-diphospho-decaprenol L-rhamnosyltransferase
MDQQSQPHLSRVGDAAQASAGRLRAVSDVPPLVRVIVVNFNAGQHLRRCLECLAAQTEARFEAIVVDNASMDGSLGLTPADARFKTIELPANFGFARANNIAVEDCDAPFVALLNPDAFAEPSWLAALLRAAKQWPAAVMFGSLQVCADRPEILDGAGDNYFCAGGFWRGGQGRRRPKTAPAGEPFGPCAAAALYRTEWLQRVGGFDERFFCYAEDVDLAFRLRLAGGRCVQVPDAVVTHVGSAIAGALSDFSVYHVARNLVWTFVKCMPGPLLPLLLPCHIALLAAIWVRAMQRGQGRVVARAFRDALRGLPGMLATRRTIQAQRRASLAEIAAAMVWRPDALWRRAIVLRPLPRQARAAEPIAKSADYEHWT